MQCCLNSVVNLLVCPLLKCVNLCFCVKSFEKAALEYQDQLSAITGIDCSLKSSEDFLLMFSNNISSPKHTSNGNQQIALHFKKLSCIHAYLDVFL